MEEENIIINAISKSLSTEIKYITLALTININPRNPNKFIEKPIAIMLSRDNIYILLQNIKSIKFQFSYEVIEKIVIDDDKRNALKLVLNPELILSPFPKLSCLYLFVKDRRKFVKTLLCYHSIYTMEKKGEMSEIRIIKKSLLLKNIDFRKSLLSKDKNIILQNPPNFSLFTHRSGYSFYLKNNYENKGDVFSFPQSELEITVSVSQLMYIDRMSKDSKDIYLFAMSKLIDYVTSNNIKHYWILKTQFYIKKMNITMDKALWEGFRIEIRTNNSDAVAEGDGEFNIGFIFLRRKFIPPFYDTYIDITLILKEKLNRNKTHFTSEAKTIFETIADSFHYREAILNQSGYRYILEAKIEALLLDEASLSFFSNVLEMKGNSCRINAMNYLYKLLISLEQSVHDDNIENIKKNLWTSIVSLNTKANRNFNAEEHKKRLIHSDIDTFIREFSQLFNTGGSSTYFNKVKDAWDAKMWRYIAFCVDGGLTDDAFTISDLIEIYSSVSDNVSLYHAIQIQLNNMLNIRLINTRGEKLDAKITSLINQMSDIRSFEYNENVMNAMIRSGSLKTIQNIDNDNNMANFIKFMLENSPSYQFLRALTHHIKTATLKQNDSIRKSFLVILAPLVNIFANRLFALNALEAGRALCLLTSTESDKNNRQRAILNNVLTPIVTYIDYPDEKLMYTSLVLLKNILPEIKETLTKMKNTTTLVERIVDVFRGTKVFACYHEIKTIISCVNVIIDLIKIQSNLFKEILFKLDSDERTEFFNFLFEMLYKKDNTIGDEKMLCELHTAIFSLFDIYCRKSQEEKLKRMNKEGRVEEMMNVLSGEYAAFVENVLKMSRENMKKFPDVEVKIRMIKAMMTFSFFFLTQSNELKEKLKENTESSFISLVNLICDNKQKESIRELITVGASIKQEIIDFDDIEDNAQ